MPNRDGRGPLGKGPETGNGFGVCRNYRGNQLNGGFHRRGNHGRYGYQQRLQCNTDTAVTVFSLEKKVQMLKAELERIENIISRH